MPPQSVAKSRRVNSRRPAKLTDYFSRKTTSAAASTRPSSPLSSLSSSPTLVTDRRPVKNDELTAPAMLSTTRKSSRLSALKSGDTPISSGPSTRTSASTKSVLKSSTASPFSVSVGAPSLKHDHTPRNEPQITRYRTRQTGSSGASSIRRQPAPSTKSRSISLQVSPAKPTAKRKEPPSCNSDAGESDDVVYVPRVTLSDPSVMKENLPPTQDDRLLFPPALKKLKLDPTCSAVYAPSSLSEEHELTLPPSLKPLPEVRENVQRWRASSISCPPLPPPDVEMEDAPVQGDVDDEFMEDDFVPSSQSQPYLDSVSHILPTPSPELRVEALSKVMSLVSSPLTSLETTPDHQSPLTPPPPSSPPRKSSTNYRPLSPPPSDLPEELTVDTVEDDVDVIARLKAEVAAELALDLPDSDGPSVPGDLSDDSSSDEELRWSPALTKTSTCVRASPISS